MLGIPFINQYIQKVVKEQVVADSVDWLNYYVTSLLLAFFSLAISAKQYFGSPIQCWVPNEFRGGWEKYAEDYCFIANSYHVPWDGEIPGEADREDQISYYRWVPIVLALQAVCFFVPNWLWNMMHKQTAVNPRAAISETMKCKDLHGEDRAKEVKNVALYIHETIDIFNGPDNFLRTGRNATALYMFTKFLYLVNVFAQLYMMNHFLGGDYMSWGWDTLKDLSMNREWSESPIFPRVIMCDFEVRRLANRQRYSVQCVIMMNMINEKLYLFLYVWLIFVGVATLINFLFTAAVFALPMWRRAIVMANLSKEDIYKKHNAKNRDVFDFINKYLHADGVLLLQFVRQNAGGRVARDLVDELFRLHLQKKNETYLEEYSPESVRAGKRPIKYRNRQSNYTPTVYGPSSIYPGIEEPDTAKLMVGSPQTKQESTAPPSEDIHSYDDGTLPIDEARRANALENIYTTSHVADV